MNGKSETHRDPKNLLKNLRGYCKKLKNQRLEETQKMDFKTHHKCHSEISKLNEKHSETYSFLGNICHPYNYTNA